MINKNTITVKQIFNRISCKYDLLNNIFSFGLHNLWKKKLISLLKPKNGEIWADLCCGTGDMSILINKKVFPNGCVIGVDNADEILKIASNKSKKIKNRVISWDKKDVFEMDASHMQFDGICMSYGLRNLDNIENGIDKVFSLLNEKGRAGFLDFNHADEKTLADFFQKLYLRLIVVPIAFSLNLKEEYSYIEKSIRCFPKGKDLMSISKKIGFRKIKYETMCGGQMGILILEK